MFFVVVKPCVCNMMTRAHVWCTLSTSGTDLQTSSSMLTETLERFSLACDRRPVSPSPDKILTHRWFYFQ
jgi:hypothetical protein